MDGSLSTAPDKVGHHRSYRASHPRQRPAPIKPPNLKRRREGETVEPPTDDVLGDTQQPGRTKAKALTIWVAPDPIDEKNGCLRFVRVSHKDGVRPHSRSSILGFSQHIANYDDLKADEVGVKLNPGDASVHHGNMIHRADANVSTERNRRAFAMVVVMQRESCEIDEETSARHTATATQHVKEMSGKS